MQFYLLTSLGALPGFFQSNQSRSYEYDRTSKQTEITTLYVSTFHLSYDPNG